MRDDGRCVTDADGRCCIRPAENKAILDLCKLEQQPRPNPQENGRVLRCEFEARKGNTSFQSNDGLACDKLIRLPGKELILRPTNCPPKPSPPPPPANVTCPIFCTLGNSSKNSTTKMTEQLMRAVVIDPSSVLSLDEFKGKGICSSLWRSNSSCPEGFEKNGTCSASPACGVCCVLKKPPVRKCPILCTPTGNESMNHNASTQGSKSDNGHSGDGGSDSSAKGGGSDMEYAVNSRLSDDESLAVIAADAAAVEKMDKMKDKGICSSLWGLTATCPRGFTAKGNCTASKECGVCCLVERYV
eukprot:gene4437-4692_t